MTSHEFIHLWRPVVAKIAVWDDTDGLYHQCLRLEQLLDCKEYTQYLLTKTIANEKPLPADLKNKLILLAGPHSQAVITVLKLRRGYM